MNLWTLIVQPQVFFQQLSDRPVTLGLPLAMVVSASWLRYIAFFIWTRNLPFILPAELSQVTPRYWLGAAVLGLLCWPLVSWGIYGGIIQLLTHSRWRAWQVAGWTQWPMTLMGVVILGIAGLLPATGRVIPYDQFLTLSPKVPWVAQYRTWLELYTQTLQEQAFGSIIFWLVLLGSGWSLWLLYWGVKALAPTKALITTTILAAGVFVWRTL
ncbi:hypothetical protein [Acaryochloris sp. IP29b_bin.148]|uniref:hypothetical protein n=1 Tax=Acaryochloris sp. IP29b_bin.148 TaxID=2969218 RepID=UPI00262C2167|nr:hypothetical protein [Acaryochloris sp. IP29b_bin.148]